MIFLIFFKQIDSEAQHNQVVLKYSVISKQLNEISIQKLGLREAITGDPDFEIPLNSKQKGVTILKLKTKGLYKIADAIDGHIVFLDNDDTCFIELKELPNLKQLLSKGVYLKYFNTLTAKGKYSWHYTFFDELNRRTDNIYEPNKNMILKNPMLFKTQCDKALQIGEKLIDSLYSKNKISLSFKTVVQQELNARYVSWMCTPLAQLPKNKLPNNYFEKINVLKFNDSAFAVQCREYIQAGALYTYYIHNIFDTKHYYTNLSNEIESILLNYSGIVKDKLLGWQIKDYIGKDYPAFDSCYQIFLRECKNQKIKKDVIYKVNAFVKPIKNLPKIELSELLIRSKVQNKNGESILLSTLIKDSAITIIDCWASWCIPCREQMPFIHDFEKKFQAKLNIIYLSFDKDETKWKSFLEKNNLKGNQFLMDNDFSSEFSMFFDLQTIPRYILLSKGGIKVLNAQMPIPALEEEFEQELEKYFK